MNETGNPTPAPGLLAVVRGEGYTQAPADLYIPPDALRVVLQEFEGPLDLLLYLIRKQNLDILDIPIARITAQYMEYIELMQELQLELAGEYLVMAAMLAEIKSRMLLPRPQLEEEEEQDPRAELARRILEYERYRIATDGLDRLPRMERDVHVVRGALPVELPPRPLPPVQLEDLLAAIADVLERTRMFSAYQVQREELSVRERMSMVLEQLEPGAYTEFTRLFTAQEGRSGLVVALLAILELLRESLVEVMQEEDYGAIKVKAA